MNLTTEELEAIKKLIEAGEADMIRSIIDALKIQVDPSHEIISAIYDSRNLNAGQKHGIAMSMIKIPPKPKNEETQMNLTTEELQRIVEEEMQKFIDEKASKKSRRKKRRKVKKKKAKKDACYHKVRSRYDVWPSAYASGALVKCRKVGAKNWGNKSKKEESLHESEGEFKPHMMYDPKSSKKEKANKVEDHERLAKKGYTHVDPAKIREIIGVGQGGAAGMDPFLKEFGKEMKDEIIKTLEAMPDIGKHKNGDYVMKDGKQIDVVKEQKKNCGCGQDPCKTYGRQDELQTEAKKKKSAKDKMKCNSPRRIRKGEPGHGKKKFVVKACDKGKEKIIRYGDANMEIKKDSPDRRKSFRARHKCGQKKSKMSAGYWSCKKW